MLVTVLKSKVHRATVTDSNLSYEGSLTMDTSLMSLVGIREYEQVQVVNINNGERFDTYVIKGDNDGKIIVNGAAARLVQPDDLIIIMAYAQVDESELESFKPSIVRVNEKNEPVKKFNTIEV